MNRSRWYDGKDFKLNRDQVKGLPREFRTRLRRELLLDRLTVNVQNQSLITRKSSLNPRHRHHSNRQVTWSMNGLHDVLNTLVDDDTSSLPHSSSSIMMDLHHDRSLRMNTKVPTLGSVKSAKSRHKTLLQDSQRFRQVLEHPEFRKNPLSAIHHHISSQSISSTTIKIPTSQ